MHMDYVILMKSVWIALLPSWLAFQSVVDVLYESKMQQDTMAPPNVLQDAELSADMNIK